jgi:DNA sulfur modification protein DndE
MMAPTLSPPRSVRITNRGRDQLIQIKRKLPFENWNAICRWALVQSLQEGTAPPKLDDTGESNVEMSWDVFTGGTGWLYWELMIEWALEHEIELNREELDGLLRRHIHRGIAALAGRPEFGSLEGLLTTVLFSKA